MNKIIYKKMKDYLVECGFEIGVYSELGITNRAPHSIGLPSRTYVKVKPDYSPVDGLCTVLVMADQVCMMTLKTPYNYNEWQVYRSKEYAHAEEMCDILMDYQTEAVGPWR